MDCPSEESLIRLKLESLKGLKHLDFNIANRTLIVFHTGMPEGITSPLAELKLEEELITSEITENVEFSKDDNQRKLLWAVLIINLLFFGIEIIGGWLSKSMGLLADSLDMLADSFVYAISLMAVGATTFRKKKIAAMAGYFQIILALLGLAEVLRRVTNLQEFPAYTNMMIISFAALMANTLCLYLLKKSKGKNEPHLKASMIFTSNDIIINSGVIVAGLLVYLFQSQMPDLIIGVVIFVLVIQGAIRILKLGK